MERLLAASIDRLARSRPRGPVGYAVAALTVGAAIVLVELYLVSLDHGTHLLMGLVLVAGTAALVGPGPAMSGLVVGGVASVVTIADVLQSPLTWIELAVYLVVGAAILAFAWVARRSTGPAALLPVPAKRLPNLIEPLTPRELEVLRLAATGIAVETVCARLYLSPNTVKTHLTHIYAKLGVRGRSDAVRAALHYGCLTPADICPHRYGDRSAESPLRARASTRSGDDASSRFGHDASTAPTRPAVGRGACRW